MDAGNCGPPAVNNLLNQKFSIIQMLLLTVQPKMASEVTAIGRRYACCLDTAELFPQNVGITFQIHMQQHRSTRSGAEDIKSLSICRPVHVIDRWPVFNFNFPGRGPRDWVNVDALSQAGKESNLCTIWRRRKRSVPHSTINSRQFASEALNGIKRSKDILFEVLTALEGYA